MARIDQKFQFANVFQKGGSDSTENFEGTETNFGSETHSTKSLYILHANRQTQEILVMQNTPHWKN